MASYRVNLQSKGPSECNIARILQAVELGPESDVSMEEVRTEVAPVVHDGPMKSEGRVSSRKSKDDFIRPTEYSMKATNKRQKTFMWNGVSEETGRYAVLVRERDELKMILCDHWYKFSRCQELVQQPIPTKEMNVISKKEKEKLREEQVSRQVLGDDSEEDESKPKKKRRVQASDEEDEGREGMDFDQEFTDDEESKISSDESDVVTVAKATKLSNSGKEIKRAIDSDSDSFASSGGSDIGLNFSDEEPQLLQLTKDAVVNELMRLGKVTMTDFVKECKTKFKAEDRRWREELKQILLEVADLHKEGTDLYLLLKETFKRSIPKHGKRVYFQKLQK